MDKQRNELGVMQGRLSPRPRTRLQQFPRSNWQREFTSAAELGFAAIEWLFEADTREHNPLLTAEGRRRIRQHAAATGVQVRSVCADYFMIHRLSDPEQAVRAHATATLNRLIADAADLGATRILLPLLERAALLSERDRDTAVESIETCLPAAERAEVALGLEMEIPGTRYADFIARFDHPLVGAYYDTGNSAAQGLNIATDIDPLLPKLIAVHVKDRRQGGRSVALGSGDADLKGFVARVLRAGFRGDFVLQHYFDEAPQEQAAQALAFVRDCLAEAAEEAA